MAALRDCDIPSQFAQRQVCRHSKVASAVSGRPDSNPRHGHEDEELVDLDLTAEASPEQPDTFFARLMRCGNPRDTTPLPWAQLSVVMLVSFSEGT